MNINHREDKYLTEKDFTEAQKFWQNTLSSFSAPTPLTVDRIRSVNFDEAKDNRYGRQEIRLSKALTSTLQSLAQKHELTFKTLVQGAWALLLSRYCGEEDIVFGATTVCRHSAREEPESRVELFSNTLPFRVRVPSEMALVPWLKELRSQWLVLQEYNQIPLAEIQRWSDIPPEQPLFESTLIFETSSLKDELRLLEEQWTNVQSQGENCENREFQRLGQTKYPLTIVGYLEPECLLQIEYDRSRFHDGTIARMLGHIQTLLEGMPSNPEQRLWELPLLSAAERHQLIVEWNNTQVDYPKDTCIHQLFEAQMERTPDAVAVVFEDKQLTYRELNAKANQLAYYLQKLGVKPDVLVALCVERSLEMVVGLLGILKAGGGYVPLDPAYPPERVSFMLSDAQVPVLLTQKSLVDGLPDEAQVLCLDTDWEVIAQEGQENPSSDVVSHNLAYVIYTSGSTGKPKGVQLCHQSVVNFLLSMGQQPGLTEQDILLAVTTISFDIAVLELYLPLITGAKVVLVSREVAANGAKLLEMLVNSGATIMQATPASWRLLLAAGWNSSDRVKILCGGEAMPRELAYPLLERCTSVWNVYGPTETTVWSTAYKVETSQLAQSHAPAASIGRPIANTQLYILDAHLQPVPIGVAGELHIGGDGLARGYLNRPELTQEKFIPDPFSNKPGARLYKTGDLARYLPDGNIDYIGRIDHQVKIRGFRIELGEIEAVLAQHPVVHQGVVIAREDVPGDKRLVAYLVAKQEQKPTLGELRRFLKEQLTDYMVPAAFVWLDALPLTPNGKVNRRALPAPELVQQELTENFIAPRDDLEFQLMKIWEDVLGIQPIGMQDNLFELGGHSLLIARLSDQIEQAFHKHLPLATIFQAPTIEQLANILRQDTGVVPERSLTAIQPHGNKSPLFLCEGVSIYYPLVPYLGLEQPLYGLVAPIGERQSFPKNYVKELAAHYVQEIQTLQPEGPYFLGGLSFGGLVALETAQQLIAKGQTVALLVIFDTVLSTAYKPLSVYKRIYYHLNKIVQLGPAYVLTQLGKRSQEFKQKMMRFYNKLRLDHQEFIPHSRQYFALLEVNDQAEREYVPQAYSGRVVVFKAIERVDANTSHIEVDLGWGKLASEGVEIYEIPADHIGILKEPHVKALAETLQVCLEREQADNND